MRDAGISGTLDFLAGHDHDDEGEFGDADVHCSNTFRISARSWSRSQARNSSYSGRRPSTELPMTSIPRSSYGCSRTPRETLTRESRAGTLGSIPRSTARAAQRTRSTCSFRIGATNSQTNESSPSNLRDSIACLLGNGSPQADRPRKRLSIDLKPGLSDSEKNTPAMWRSSASAIAHVANRDARVWADRNRSIGCECDASSNRSAASYE